MSLKHVLFLNEFLSGHHQHFSSSSTVMLYCRPLGHQLNYNVQGISREEGPDAYTSYAYYPKGPHCDKGRRPGPVQGVSGVSAFPGGSVKRAFGFDFGKMAFDMTSKSEGEAGAGAAPPATMASQGLALGAGLLQSLVAGALHVVPPLIPPPVWNNQPLPCAPMITGHTCFGAVLYPITMSDF
eukprot:10155322-Karenia_brevis.AAC.1